MRDEFLPEHGGQLRELARQFDVPEATLVDFSASIDPNPPSEVLVHALCKAIRGRRILTAYPDMHYTDLKRAIAGYAAVDVSAIAVGSGVMPLLGAAVHALGLRKCLVPVPSFAEYRKILAVCGAQCHSFTVTPEADFLPDVEEMVRALKASGAQAVLLANPQSPSGRLMRAGALLQLYEAACAMGAATLVDEAFIDYAPDASLCGWAAKLPGLIVLRSLTKFFAMPGLRVAYAVATPEMKSRIEEALPAWPAGSVAAEAARMALEDSASIDAKRAANVEERNWLADQLRSLGLRVFPSAANYLLLKIDDGLDGFEFWRRMIVDDRVVLRCCANFEGLNEHYFRIGVRTRHDNRILLEAFKTALRRCSQAGPPAA
jgi:threonine-phosphate decarboxylase